MAEQFSLVLGCGGYSYNNFSLCSGTHNIIINFDRHFDALELKGIMDFLDYACGLFDSTMGDWNKIVNTLKMFRDRYRLIDDKTWEVLHMWLPQHKRCGAFLRLMFNADIQGIFKPEEAHIEPDYLECPVAPIIIEPEQPKVQLPKKKTSSRKKAAPGQPKEGRVRKKQ